MKLKKLFGAIQKIQDQDDGTIIVEGVASTEDEDSDKEIVKADAMRSAIPDYMKFGAVREMHQPLAAGTALEINVDDNNITTLKAHIVDSEAIKKVKTGVYKGFSIGGSVTKRDDLNKSIVTGIQLVEISLVDRPANPSAVITCYKADGLSPAEENAIDPLTKSMGDVKEMANVLQDIMWLIYSVKDESRWRGDDSPIPEQLRAWIESGAEIFSTMAQEEVATMVTRANEICKAEGCENLRKAEVIVSHPTKAELDAIRQTIEKCAEQLSNIKVYSPEDAAQAQIEKGTDAGELKKVTDDLTLAKASLAKVEQERDTLQKRVTELEKQPETPKAALMNLSKAEDTSVIKKDQVEPVLDGNGEVNEIATMIKSAQAQRI
ncbi:HK97 family phage prohead protease [Acinetobacter pittii]|uniref:HK97 family phage prohead protease n=1 Tax=Acinetobacter pittii TaxID=48296 RepID=UPI00190088A3|nr:XkdF-like putative serine protease domain-containing protein [Acinetobacter pittii]MBJ8472545.1 HK97 family phage prohead protease [Acinetobacter pittii]